MILSSLDADTVLHHMLLVVRNYFGASRCAVYLVDSASNELYCRAQNGYPVEASQKRLSIGKESVAGWAAFTRAPLYVSDAGSDKRHKIDDPSLRSLLALPLIVRERAVGVLEIGSDAVNAFTKDDVGLLSVFAGQAAIALENARLYFTDLRRMRQIEIINLIARTAAASHDTQQFYSMLVDLISDTFEGTMIAIVLCSPQGHLLITAHAGMKETTLERLSESRQRGLLADAFSQKAIAVANDAGSRSNWPSCFPRTGSELCAPLVSLGEVLGAIVVAHQDANFFSTEDRGIAQAAADVCATAARNVQLAEELRRVANLDPLTGLFNQQYFHNALAQEIPRARRHKKEFALVMLDLRGFRKINATVGLEVGDAFLRQVAAALKSGLRGNDVVCRYLGDRFALLLPEVNAEGMAAVEEKLRQSIHSLQIPGYIQPVSAAWAHVHFPQDGSADLELTKLLLNRLEKNKQQSSGAGV